MTKVHDSEKNDNQTSFTAAIGKGPARPTRFGTAIDVFRIDGGKREWGDLVPTNPELLPQLCCGQCIEVVDVEIVTDWYRTMWRGKIKILEQ